jgi:heme exporter protein B
MRQRLSLARALLHDPALLLLDEPFSNVDAGSAQAMVRVLAGMRDAGKTLFIVTHQAGLLEGVADEFVSMAAGKIVARGEEWGGGPGQGAVVNTAMARRAESRVAAIAAKPRPSGSQVFRATLMKDLRLEWRSKDAINSMLFFALLVVVIFSFSFEPTAEESRRIAGGLIWVAFLFAATVALNQTWARELRNQVLDAYRVSPAPANPLFLAKAAGNFIFVAVLELLMAPLFTVFYNLRSIGPLYQLAIVGMLGTWALVANGTFFAAISVHTRSREVMLPLILFPISIPALMAMVQSTTIILTGEGASRFWVVLLAVYDVVFTTVGLLLFETVLHAE